MTIVRTLGTHLYPLSGIHCLSRVTKRGHRRVHIYISSGSTVPSPATLPAAMTTFTYSHSIESPTSKISHIFGFSRQGKYLALGDGVARRIYILDTEQQEATCIPTVVALTSLVWDPIKPKQFVVGFGNGRFSLCSFLGVEISEIRFDALVGRGAVQSLALAANGLTLAVAVSYGDVFIFHRKSCSGTFLSFSCHTRQCPLKDLGVHLDLFKLIVNATSEYHFRSDRPNPRSLCFTSDGALFISYEREGILWVLSLFIVSGQVKDSQVLSLPLNGVV